MPNPSRCLLLATLFSLLALPPLAAKERSPLEITIQSAAGTAVAAAAVTVTVQSGAPFTVEGSSDKRGRFRANLPDFTRAYKFQITKDGFAPIEQTVDFSTQKLTAGMTAAITVTLDEKRGPTAEELYNEGVGALRTNDFATAEAKVRQAAELRPDLVQAWSVLGMLAADAQRWPDALDAADRALALAPADVSALRSRNEALNGLGREEEAAAALDALAAADRTTDTARLLFNAGAEAWGEKDAAVATRRFEQAFEFDPQLFQAQAALAEVKIGSNDLPGALAALEKALEVAPANVKLWQRKLDVQKALGRADDAEASAKRIAELGGVR